jgi:hypothetical protein
MMGEHVACDEWKRREGLLHDNMIDNSSLPFFGFPGTSIHTARPGVKIICRHVDIRDRLIDDGKPEAERG